MPFGNEGQYAQENKDGHWKAYLDQLVLENSIAEAFLHSGSIMGNDSVFAGNVVYVNNEIRQVHLRNEREAGGCKYLWDFHKIFSFVRPKLDPWNTNVIPVAYNHGILALRLGLRLARCLELEMFPHNILLLMVIDRTVDGRNHRVLGEKKVPFRARHFLEITPSYLWYGWVGNGAEEIYGMDLDKGTPTKLERQDGNLVQMGICAGKLCVIRTGKSDPNPGLFSFRGDLYFPHEDGPARSFRFEYTPNAYRRGHLDNAMEEIGRRFSIHAEETTGNPVLLVSLFLRDQYGQTSKVRCHIFTTHSLTLDETPPKVEFEILFERDSCEGDCALSEQNDMEIARNIGVQDYPRDMDPQLRSPISEIMTVLGREGFHKVDPPPTPTSAPPSEQA